MNYNLVFNKYSYLLIIVMCFCGSCRKNSWYDVKTNKNLSVPSTLTDMQAMMDYADILNVNSPGLGEAGSDGHYVIESKFSTMEIQSRNAYTWSHDQPYENVSDWNSTPGRGPYPKVFYCNVVIEGLNKITSTSIDEYNQLNDIRGQALFHRAKSFYELSQIFAPAYNTSTADVDLGIVLRLESDINKPSVRSSVKQTYEQIINDLREAINLLPITPKYKTRPSKPSAFGLLARVYLSMEDYKNAGNYADSCLQLFSTLIDYNTLSQGSSAPFKLFNNETIFHSEMNILYALVPSAYMLIDSALYASYDSNDLRKKLYFTKNPSSGQISYKGSYSGTPSNMFTGISTNEMYLIRAECNSRDGKVELANKDINYLLRRRWNNSATYPEFNTSSAQEALMKTLEERKKELLLRGLRWSDLRRLNKDDRFKVIISRKINGIVYNLMPKSFNYTFPIPDDIIRITGIAQNVGW